MAHQAPLKYIFYFAATPEKVWEGFVSRESNRILFIRISEMIGYVTPKDMLAGHQQEIQAERDRKLDAAKEQRKNRRQGAA
ncbi:MAG TPA: hypothetical protein VOA78_04465 [Candidatus Dormibacteraeota bacterium]|nr:hypothetical protein [Candidatus Dormibacteraeota bacterium]